MINSIPARSSKRIAPTRDLLLEPKSFAERYVALEKKKKKSTALWIRDMAALWKVMESDVSKLGFVEHRSGIISCADKGPPLPHSETRATVIDFLFILRRHYSAALYGRFMPDFSQLSLSTVDPRGLSCTCPRDDIIVRPLFASNIVSRKIVCGIHIFALGDSAG